MNATLIILAMALVTFVPRLAGFLLASSQLPAFWRRFLHFVPVAVFAALVVPALPGEPGETPVRLIAAALSALALYYAKSLWIGIAVGMGVFWLLR